MNYIILYLNTKRNLIEYNKTIKRRKYNPTNFYEKTTYYHQYLEIIQLRLCNDIEIS